MVVVGPVGQLRWPSWVVSSFRWFEGPMVPRRSRWVGTATPVAGVLPSSWLLLWAAVPTQGGSGHHPLPTGEHDPARPAPCQRSVSRAR